jgi:hypothetical protein
MKPFITILAAVAVFSASCSSSRVSRSGDYDDVYYSSSDAPSRENTTAPEDYTPSRQNDEESNGTEPRFDYGNNESNSQNAPSANENGSIVVETQTQPIPLQAAILMSPTITMTRMTTTIMPTHPG